MRRVLFAALLVTGACGPTDADVTLQDPKLEAFDDSSSEQGLTSQELAEEWDFFNRLNGARAANGRGALRMQTGTRTIAREWSGHLLAVNQLSHRPDLRAERRLPRGAERRQRRPLPQRRRGLEHPDLLPVAGLRSCPSSGTRVLPP